MAERITNNDIWERLGMIEEISLATKEQAEKTNGRVTKIELWQAGVVALENHPKNADPGIDYTKIILAALGLIGTALSVITVLANK